MKILKLSFENLNSLVGAWEIDFTAKEYSRDGLFVITGPTGSGKSTILDAICLALYGCTPRLANPGVDPTAIMSRKTAKCSAKVLFETKDGRYHSTWSQHRASKDPNGKLQDAKHELVNADTHEILSAQKKSVVSEIIKLTGMDFKHFKRSVLLAQGDFAAFLEASGNERSPILEQITGTEFYGVLSTIVYKRKGEENKKLEDLEVAKTAIGILTPEGLHQIQLELTEKGLEIEVKRQNRESNIKAVDWLKKIAELKNQHAQQEVDGLKLAQKLENFKENAGALEWAKKAAKLEGPFGTLHAVRKQCSDETEKLKKEEKELPRLESSAQTIREQHALAKKRYDEAQTLQIAAKDSIDKVKTIDERGKTQAKALSDEQKKQESIAADIDAQEKHKTKIKDEQGENLDKHRQIVTYLEEHASDKALVSKLTGIEAQIREIGKKQNKKTDIENERLQAEAKNARLADKVTEAKKVFARKNAELLALDVKAQQLEEDRQGKLGERLLREYVAERDNFVQRQHDSAIIASLEKHRLNLQDGSPCPVCGSKNHPLAHQNVPQADAFDLIIKNLTVLIGEIDALNDSIKDVTEAKSRAYADRAESDKQLAAITKDMEMAVSTHADIQDKLAKCIDEIDEDENLLWRELRPLEIVKNDSSDLAQALNRLRERLAQWEKLQQSKAELDGRISEQDKELHGLDKWLEAQRERLAQDQKTLDNAFLELERLRKERFDLYGTKDPYKEELRLQEAVSQGLRDVEATQQTLNTQANALENSKTRMQELTLSIENLEAQRLDLEQAFSTSLATAGFLDETHFASARIDEKTCHALEQQAKELDTAVSTHAALQAKTREDLCLEKSKHLSDKGLEELQEEVKTQGLWIDELQRMLIRLDLQQKENDEKLKLLDKQLAAIEVQKPISARWTTLNALIGSANGESYRQFAQDLTFGIVIDHANGILSDMDNRYRLIKDTKKTLEFDVEDTYQGEIRQTKSLSGGESFLVSLALALGLSKMASRGNHLNSLFLDEGFGTLDEETLNMAIDSLMSLQQSGTVIGVISHVLALQERIQTRICITPSSAGNSTICGPDGRSLRKASSQM